MPTGYTAKLFDGPQSFDAFVLAAARGMSPLMIMRDSDPEALPPRRLEPDIRYYEAKIAEAKDVLVQLENYSPERRDREALVEYEREASRHEERQREVKAREGRYEEMLRRVREWEVPPSLDSFRDFMIEQLTTSLKFDTSTTPGPLRVSGEEWLNSKRDKATRDILYYREQMENEIERTNERNAWLSDLWAALDGVFVKF